jgi:ABC-2 type transport system ATP-binding protein
MRVNVVHLKKYYGPTRAVDDISFAFGSGQIIGFVGPNGAGKTTTMRILATLDEPTDGDALIDGVSVVEEPEKVRRLVGYVPDQLPTHRDLSVDDYLDFFGRVCRLKGPHRRQMIERVVEFTNLAGIRDKYLVALSQGMKQRVSVARSLLHDPPVLIMDEPTAGLDPRARIELRELLKMLSWQGKAILISSHILTELAELCTGVVIIEHGKILRAGTMEQVLGDVPKKTVHSPAQRHADATARAPDTRSGKRACWWITMEVEVHGSRRLARTCSQSGPVGLPRSRFRLRRADLEELFMNVTRERFNRSDRLHHNNARRHTILVSWIESATPSIPSL